MYTLNEAAEIIGVTTRTLTNWKERGWILTIKLPNGHHRIDQREIERLQVIESRAIEAQAVKVKGGAR
jgi:predicted site-specific integrase-resolvase